MQGLKPFGLALVLAALVPLADLAPAAAPPPAAEFPGWPSEYRQRDIQRLELSPQEQGFAKSFPGKIAKFRDSHHQYIVRWIQRPTRRLHPADDCYRASGYTVRHLPRCPAGTGASGCFEASRNGSTLVVHERIIDKAGKTWTDVSAWYWAAQMAETAGPWWSVTTIRGAR